MLWNYSDWNALLARSFEQNFYIPLEKDDDKDYSSLKTEYVNRRGIYKDTVGSKAGYTDYQLRPNICVAMAVV